MLYGLFLSAQGAKTQSTRLDVIANNLANAATTGFKKSLAIFQNHRSYAREHGATRDVRGNLNASTGGVTVAETVTDFSQGPLKATGGKLDVAITGAGFLQVADANGRQFLTRNGHLTTTTTGDLVMAGTGHRVLSDGGEPISIPPGADDIKFGSDGTVSIVADGVSSTVGRIAIVAPRSLASLKARGDSLYESTTPVSPAGSAASIEQGYLEGSGVNAVRAMTDMIEASRSFEMNANLIKHQDESLARLLQALPRR